MIELAASDSRLCYSAPQEPVFVGESVRLERFPRATQALLKGQIGPLANLRSAPQCGVGVVTDSPFIELRLQQLRHHQPMPVALDAEMSWPDGRQHVSHGADIRELRDACCIRLATGCVPGDPATVWLWLPVISTCQVSSVALADGSSVAAADKPEADWLAIGDSLTQGFTVQQPSQTWVHRVARKHQLTPWNLGVAGIRIEAEVFSWALAERDWRLVTINLGANHAHRAEDVATAGERAAAFAEAVIAAVSCPILWILPPWRPCEDGLGPTEFMGVPLDTAAGQRTRQVREALQTVLASYEPSIRCVLDPMPHEYRAYPDGLHPQAAMAAHCAAAVSAAIPL